MRKWVIFVGLKVVEVVALSSFLYLMYVLGSYLNGNDPFPWYIDIITAICFCGVIIIGIAVSCLIIFKGIPSAISKNIEWAKRIDRKLFGRK